MLISVATAQNRPTRKALAKAIAAADYGPLERLFLGQNARPPLVVWRPEREMLRSPVLERLLDAWKKAPRGRLAIPPLAAASGLIGGADGEWTMLLAPEEPLAGAPEPGLPATLDQYVYRHYGAGIVRHYGRDMSGRTMAAFPGHIGTFFAAVYEAVRLRPEPIFTEHEPPAAVLVRSWRRLILPLAGAAGQVAGFVVGNIPESAVGTLLDVMYDAALVIGGDGRIRLANRAAAALLGTAGSVLMGGALDDHLPGLAQAMQSLAGEIDGVGALGRHELALGRGRRRRVLEVAIGGTRVAGEPLFVLVLRDLTERAERERALESIAFRDELTGILNRRGLQHSAVAGPRWQQQRARRRADGFGLLILDLDGFKSLNDRFGHAGGDAVLVAVARRLAAALRGEDAVARWGGDEFVVVLDGVAGTDDLAVAAAKLLAAIARPLTIEGSDVAVTASVGGALHPRDGVDFEAVLAAADRALYLAKQAGGNRISLAGEAAPGKRDPSAGA